MKIYTKTGDKGKTSLYGGGSVSKNHIRIESYGTVDELNASLGIVRLHDLPEAVSQELLEVQNDLFTLGAELATPKEELYLDNGKCRLPRLLSMKDVEKIESWIDHHEERLEPLQHFILPGGEAANAHCHMARTICRRAERMVVALSENAEIREECIIYLNRLSDYLFVLARLMSKLSDKPEIKWIP